MLRASTLTPERRFRLWQANKLDRIEKDIEKTKDKIAALQSSFGSWKRQKTEQENLQIIQLVRGLNMTPQEFAAFVRGGALQAAPAPQPGLNRRKRR